MFKRFIWKASSDRTKLKLFQRFRMTKPNCPHPYDFSKVEKVTICGASTLLGQYLAYVLKRADIIKEIALHDSGNVRGLALDLEHMNTKSKVRPNSGDYALKHALRFSDIIIITNGYDACLQPDNEDLLRENAQMIYNYGVKIASSCPDALVCILTPPINIMVPLFSEVMKVCNGYDPNKIFGVCSLMEMRANSIVADYLNLDPAGVKVPIVGGVTPSTVVPLLSQTSPYSEFTDSERQKLTTAILESPEKCKQLNTPAPLSTAYAVARFVLTLAAGLCTCDCAVQTAFVRSNALPQVQYFASKIRTGTCGAILNYGLPKIHDFELELLSKALITLEADLRKAYCLFLELHACARRDEYEDYCRARKPFIIKTPCPPTPPCIPRDVCPETLPDPCAPAKSDSMRGF